MLSATSKGVKKTIKQTMDHALAWPELIPGVLVKRYKRFLTDVKLADGRLVTAHCPNTGSMQGCCEPGRPVYLSYHDDPKRKLKYSWVLIEMPTSLVGINTLVPNRLVYKSICAQAVPELCGYETAKREVKISGKSRLDLMLSNGDQNPCYVEIKNSTLVADGVALFPDAVTERGRKHLQELIKLADADARCVMFYFIQRMDAGEFRPADHIDPNYGRELRRAVKHGVEILVYDVIIDLTGIRLNRKLPFQL